MEQSVRILCSGDLHLGRISSRCGQDNDPTGSLAVREAWLRLVQCAIDRQVHLVLLSGDIADDGGNQYEAMGPLESGIALLAAHQIPVFLVAGNHDAQVLPRLVDFVAGQGVQLLGQHGQWERVDWPPDGAPQLTLIGWSYPASGRVASLPVEALALPAPAAVPVIVMAHTDYRSGGDDYAATTVEAMRAVPADLWLLGHVHAPELLEGAPRILNPGSPQAMDPGEPGCHGPWIVEIAEGRIHKIEQIPLSSVVYASVEIDLSGLHPDDELMARLKPPLLALRDAHPHQDPFPRFSCRVKARGRCVDLARRYAESRLILQEQPLLDGYGIFLDTLDMSTVGPVYELATLASREDTIGLLARLLLSLETGDASPEISPWVSLADEAALSVLNGAAMPAELVPGDFPAPVTVLKAECGRLLEALLRQMEARA